MSNRKRIAEINEDTMGKTPDENSMLYDNVATKQTRKSVPERQKKSEKSRVLCNTFANSTAEEENSKEVVNQSLERPRRKRSRIAYEELENIEEWDKLPDDEPVKKKTEAIRKRNSSSTCSSRKIAMKNNFSDEVKLSGPEDTTETDEQTGNLPILQSFTGSKQIDGTTASETISTRTEDDVYVEKPKAKRMKKQSISSTEKSFNYLQNASLDTCKVGAESVGSFPDAATPLASQIGGMNQGLDTALIVEPVSLALPNLPSLCPLTKSTDPTTGDGVKSGEKLNNDKTDVAAATSFSMLPTVSIPPALPLLPTPIGQMDNINGRLISTPESPVHPDPSLEQLLKGWKPVELQNDPEFSKFLSYVIQYVPNSQSLLPNNGN